MNDNAGKYASFSELSASQKALCERQISEDLIARSKPGALIAFLLWFCVAGLIYNKDSDAETARWLVIVSLAFIVSFGLRIYFTFIAQRQIENTRLCRTYVSIGLIVGCLTWGIMAACSYLKTPLFIHQDLILFATIGLSAGGAVAFSVLRLYTYIYVLCMMVPILIVEFFFVERMIIDKVYTVFIFIAGLLWVTVNASKEYMAVKVSNLQLLEMSNTDGLTGVKNRRYFDKQLEQELNRIQRNQGSVSLILIDIDHFKQVNDLHGHLVGDDCLLAVGECLKRSVKRISDTVARYGGEEFAIILANTNEADSLDLAERIRLAVMAINIDNNDMPVPLTVSIGVSYCKVGKEPCQPSRLISEADSALYQAKNNGRNKICSGSQLAE